MLLSKQAELDAHTQMFASNHMQPCQSEFCYLPELAWGKAVFMSSSLFLFNLHAPGCLVLTAAWQLSQAPTPTLTRNLLIPHL